LGVFFRGNWNRLAPPSGNAARPYKNLPKYSYPRQNANKVMKKPKKDPRERSKAGDLIPPVFTAKTDVYGRLAAGQTSSVDAEWVSLPRYTELIRRVRDEKDSGAALYLLTQFVDTVNQHRTEAGGGHTLPCGVHVHFEPELAAFFAETFTRIIEGAKGENGRTITLGQAFGLERQGARRQGTQLDTKPRQRLIAKQVADIACAKIAASLPKKEIATVTRGKLHAMLKTHILPARDEGDTPPSRRLKGMKGLVRQATRQAIRKVARQHGIKKQRTVAKSTRNGIYL
jgi:hypothetical protein